MTDDEKIAWTAAMACTACGKEFVAEGEGLERSVKCPHCGNENPAWSNEATGWANSSADLSPDTKK